MYGHGAHRALAFSICALLVVALGKVAMTGTAPEERAQVMAEPVVAAFPSTTEPSTTTTTSTTTTLPPTTAPPKPAPKPAPVTTPRPAPAPKAPAAPAASVPERCAEALAWAAAHGLPLPKGWGYRCPDAALSADGTVHWGTACMNMPVTCPGASYVAINIHSIGSSDNALHYVVAHEICHAIEMEATGATTEASADACAAAHGAPRPY